MNSPSDFNVRKIIVLTLVGTAFAITLQLTGVLDGLVKISKRIY